MNKFDELLNLTNELNEIERIFYEIFRILIKRPNPDDEDLRDLENGLKQLGNLSRMIFTLSEKCLEMENKAEQSRNAGKNFEYYASLEPKLLDIREDIIELTVSTQNDPSFCANVAWSLLFKQKVNTLVGYSAVKPELKSVQAHNFVTRTLYDLLPPCRNCFCLNLE